MPIMNGVEAITALRARGCNIPMLGLTGTASYTINGIKQIQLIRYLFYKDIILQHIVYWNSCQANRNVVLCASFQT